MRAYKTPRERAPTPTVRQAVPNLSYNAVVTFVTCENWHSLVLQPAVFSAAVGYGTAPFLSASKRANA